MDHEVRRPKRIGPLEGPEPPPTPPRPRQAERFQRAMNGRRAEPSLERSAFAVVRRGRSSVARRSEAPDGVRSFDDGPVAVERCEESADDTGPGAVERPAERAPPVIRGDPAHGPLEEIPDDALGPRADDLPSWVPDLVHAIVLLTARMDPDMQAWSVSIPIDARRLPETELHLSLSQHRLSLRFSTQSSLALRLLSTHRAALATELEQALTGDREISIEVT